MTRIQRIRLGIVMQTARALRVPICLHQDFLSEQRPRERILSEQACERGRVLDFPTGRIGAVRGVDDQ